MKGEKTAVGIFVIIMVIVLGGAVGILGGYYLSVRANAESMYTATEESSEGTVELLEEARADGVASSTEETVVEEPFAIAQINSVETFLETWGALIERTCEGSITQKEASQLVYQLASEGYRRNIPEGYGPLRIKGIVDKGLGSFEAIRFSEPIFEGKELALIDVTEIYANGSNSYRLKLINENNNWHFAAQFTQ